MENPTDNQKKNYGYFQFDVSFPTGATPSLLLYYDGFSDWVETYDGDESCSERKAKATVAIDLSRKSAFVDDVRPDDLNRVQKSTGRAYLRSKTNTWFFVVFANCADKCESSTGYHNCQGPLVLGYDFKFTNGADAEQREFSADEIGTMEAMYAFTAAYGALALWCLHLRERLRRKRKFHHTVAMLCWSVWVQAAGCALGLVHWAIFAQNGLGQPEALRTAIFLWHGADLLLVLLLVLLAKGWTIVRRKISANGRVRVALYMTVLTWTTVSLELWRVHVHDPATAAYHYESPPGVVLVSLRALMVVWFWYAASTTKRNYRHKVGFYAKFNAIFTLWLMAKPALVVAAVFLDDNERAVVVLIAELALAFAAHATLALMYYPDARCNKAFPFHANSSADLGLSAAFLPGAEGDYESSDVQKDEDAGVELDTGAPVTRGGAPGAGGSEGQGTINYAVSRRSVFQRISTAGGKTARLMRTMSKISADLDRALLDLQGEIECDVDH